MNLPPPEIIIIGNCMPSGHNAGNIYDPDGISPTIMNNHGYPAFVIEKMNENQTDKLIQVAQIYNEETNPTNGRVYDPCGISPTLTTPTGGNSMPLILATEYHHPIMNSRLKEMLEDGLIPFVDGLWIDTYNKGVNPEVAGTLRTTIDSANMHYVMEEISQVPFNTAEDGLAYTITTRYGAMCASNLIDGNFPMTGILTIENPTEDMKHQIEDGTLNFDKGMPKDSNPKSCAMRRREYEDGNHQTLEIGDEVSNALTSVQKDSLVLEPQMIGYSRDAKGKIINRHFMEIAGTIHGSSCTGGNTSQYVAEPSIISIVPWDRPGGDVGDIVPSITSSAWEQNNFIKIPTDGQPMVMADPRKNYGRFLPSSESSPTLLSTDYKSPHLVMEEAGTKPKGRPVLHAYEILYRMVEEAQLVDYGLNINPYQNLLIFRIRPKAPTKESNTRFRIRKLTPRECYRLMDVPEKNINRLLASGISKSQHYKLAGNSIVVSCLYHIFKSLFTNEIPENQQLSLF